MPIRIALVEDHILMMQSLKHYFNSRTRVEVVMESSDTVSLIKQLENSNPSLDVFLLDLYSPMIDSRHALRFLRSQWPQIPIVIFSICTDPVIISELFSNGIHAYVHKSAEITELISAIQTAAECTPFKNEWTIKANFFESKAHIKNKKSNEAFKLNDRQIQVLKLLCQDKSIQEISAEMYMSTSSVEKIKQQLKETTGIKTSFGLVKLAVKLGLIALTQ